MDSESKRKSHLLNEIVGELAQIQEETTRMKAEIHHALEDNWDSAGAELSEMFERFCAQISAETFEVFSYARHNLRYVPSLSIANDDRSFDDKWITFDTMSQKLDISSLRLLHLALASKEMHFDFETCQVVLPICLFDRCCALVICNTPALTKKDYGHCVSAASTFLGEFREAILHGVQASIPVPFKRAQ